MRFSLSSLLSIVAVMAAYCGVLFACPPDLSVAVLAIASCFLPALVIGGVIYARGAWQAFWIGSAVGVGPIIMRLSFPALIPIYTGDTYPGLAYAYCHLALLLSGASVVAVRWLCTSGKKWGENEQE